MSRFSRNKFGGKFDLLPSQRSMTRPRQEAVGAKANGGIQRLHSGSHSILGQDIVVHKSNRVGIESTDYSTSKPTKNSVDRK
mmetsp:Transcript_19451/g.35325  ORF Transcript_19451/g.35325 Transcript_19451/m.35325 type:complete len:82 (-) Transcript_19451:581-826(-)